MTTGAEKCQPSKYEHQALRYATIRDILTGSDNVHDLIALKSKYPAYQISHSFEVGLVRNNAKGILLCQRLLAKVSIFLYSQYIFERTVGLGLGISVSIKRNTLVSYAQGRGILKHEARLTVPLVAVGHSINSRPSSAEYHVRPLGAKLRQVTFDVGR